MGSVSLHPGQPLFIELWMWHHWLRVALSNSALLLELWIWNCGLSVLLPGQHLFIGSFGCQTMSSGSLFPSQPCLLALWVWNYGHRVAPSWSALLLELWVRNYGLSLALSRSALFIELWMWNYRLSLAPSRSPPVYQSFRCETMGTGSLLLGQPCY